MLPEVDLIEVSSTHTEWMNWNTWLGHHGMTDPTLIRAVYFNTYPLAIQAAVDGLGVALGWGHLVDRHLQSGALVRPVGDAHLRTQSGYYLLRRPGADRGEEARVVAQWLLLESAARQRYARRG